MLAPIGLRLSEEKTRVAHIDEGFDFLGWRIQRHQKRGGIKRYVYMYPAKKALASDRRQGAHDHPAGNEPAAQRPAASVEPGAAGLDQLFPSRGLQQDLLLPEPLHVATGHQLVAPQTPRAQLETVPPAMPPSRVVADGGASDAVQPRHGVDHSIPLPGHSRSRTLGRARHEGPRRPSLGSWRAGCGESRTSGSEGGPEKPTDRKVDRALWPDPYCAAARLAFEAGRARIADDVRSREQAPDRVMADASRHRRGDSRRVEYVPGRRCRAVRAARMRLATREGSPTAGSMGGLGNVAERSSTIAVRSP